MRYGGKLFLRKRLRMDIYRHQGSVGFEWLESRRMLTVTWSGGLNGYWDVAANWSSDAVPTSSTAVSITTPAGATVTVQPGETDSAGSLTIGSGVTLSMPAGVNVANPTTNWVIDPDFESASLPSQLWNWGDSGYVVANSTQYAYTGLQSLELGGTGATAVEEFAAAAGNSYSASVYAMTPTALTGNGTVFLNLYFFDSANQTPFSSGSPPNTATILSVSSGAGGPLTGSVGSAGWNHFDTSAVAPPGAAYVEVQVETYGCAAGAAVYFDDLELGPTPAGVTGSSQLNVASISNSGTLSVGPANTVTIGGAFTQTSTGTLDIQLGGAPSTGDFGLVDITGGATLAGTLKADVPSGYSPSSTDTFTPVEFSSETGSFATDAMPGGTGWHFAAAVSFTNVMISAAPTTALTATINASTSLHAVTTNLLGINMVYWDPDTGAAETQQMLTAAGLEIYRFPGGSAADAFHFNSTSNFGESSAVSISQFVEAVTADGGTGMVTVDYGSASPQEAAAELAYLLGSPADATSLGSGEEWVGGAWNSSENEWVGGGWAMENWQTAGYWASLRAAAPLATDDGLNFLRLNHLAPFSNIKDWEIGNEQYGSWAIDHHDSSAPTGPADASTYASFAEQFAALAGAILRNASLPQTTISIGIDSGDPSGTINSNWTTWTEDVVGDGLADGFVPGFISDHSYMQQAPGDESDSFLLDDTVSESGSILDWSARYADYETLLQQELGAAKAAGVQLMATEYNSIAYDPGKQSTSLVNGLFVADSLGSLLDSGYSGGFVWDLRNGYQSGDNNSNLLYGWREEGDYGQLGDPNENAQPATGPYVAYPGYQALQLASKIIQSGGHVVPAASNYGDLDVYAVKESSGDLDLLVINTNPSAALTEQFALTGFQPGGPVQVWQYGETQDTAQSLSRTGASALANSSETLTLSGSNFSFSFPAYSMTVLDLTPAPTVAAAATASPSAVTGVSTVLSVLGAYNGGESNLTYTWATSGTPPAPVTFSSNGANSAKNVTATFTKAGSYSFTVTVADPSGVTTSSSTSVGVEQTLTSITLNPPSPSLIAGGSQQFLATGLDQFGTVVTSQPTFTWSLTGGGNLTTAGLYTPPYASGRATVEAASAAVSKTAAVTYSGEAEWVSIAAASWNTGGDWTNTVSGTKIAAPGIRGITGDTVLIGSAAVGDVDLNGVSPSLAGITFNAASGSAIGQGSGGSLVLNNGFNAATLTIATGAHTISAPIELDSSVTAFPAAGSRLTISGAISGDGQSLRVNGGGTVVLSGANSYSGGTILSAGRLVASDSSAIAAGTSLTVGAGATFIFDPSFDNSDQDRRKEVAIMALDAVFAEYGR